MFSPSVMRLLNSKCCRLLYKNMPDILNGSVCRENKAKNTSCTDLCAHSMISDLREKEKE